MASLETTHHYLRLTPVKTLSQLYVKIVTRFSPSWPPILAFLWVLWTTVYEILVRTLIAQHTTSVNVPLLCNGWCQVCLIQLSWLKCTLILQCNIYSTKLKLKQFLARIAQYIVHVGWHALFLLYYFRLILCQSIKTSSWSCTCKVCRNL